MGDNNKGKKVFKFTPGIFARYEIRLAGVLAGLSRSGGTARERAAAWQSGSFFAVFYYLL